MSAAMRGGVQTWPVATEAVVAAEPLPATAAAEASPQPDPLPQAGEEPGVAAATAEAAASPAAPSPLPLEGQGEGKAEAGVDSVAGRVAHAQAGTTASTGAAPQAVATTSPADAGALGGTVLALVLVVGLILLLGWLAKRMPGVAGSGNPALRIVGSLALGPRERVVVVEVGGTQLLLSTGAGGTRALHTLEQPLPVAAPAASPFAQLLAQQFRQSVGLKSKDPGQA